MNRIFLTTSSEPMHHQEHLQDLHFRFHWVNQVNRLTSTTRLGPPRHLMDPILSEPHSFCKKIFIFALQQDPDRRGLVLLVRHTCSFTIGLKSRTDADNCELLAESKGSAAKHGLKEAEGKNG